MSWLASVEPVADWRTGPSNGGLSTAPTSVFQSEGQIALDCQLFHQLRMVLKLNNEVAKLKTQEDARSLTNESHRVQFLAGESLTGGQTIRPAINVSSYLLKYIPCQFSDISFGWTQHIAPINTYMYLNEP